NCTPPTRTPRGLTLALTVIVPLTVEPDVGEVMVTTRLPGKGGSCAQASRGRAREPAMSATRTAAKGSPPLGDRSHGFTIVALLIRRGGWDKSGRNEIRSMPQWARLRSRTLCQESP